jgi:membrane-associated protein
VFLGRFVPVARSVGFIVAGIAHMDWRRFLVYDIAGAVLWGTGHTLLGYAIGASYERWEGYLTTAGLGLVVVVVVLVGLSRLHAARGSGERDREALDTGEGERPTLRLQVGTETTDE